MGKIDRQGNEVIPARNSYQVPMVDGLVGACIDIDKEVPGLSVLGPKPGQRTPVTESKCGYFDRQGNVVIPFTYDQGRGFFDAP
jgi:WG repeat protein